MYDTDEKIATGGDTFYEIFLHLYPESYRKRFGQEMLFVFQDLYQEEVATYGKARFVFWLSVLVDMVQSVIVQHVHMIQKKGIKKYFHISVYNIIGGILLLPFIILFGLDFLGRLAQWDFTHYNRAWYTVVSRTFFYGYFPGHIAVMWIILVICPLLAVILNAIPLLTRIKNKKSLTLGSILSANPVALSIMAIGFFCLLVVYGHDVVPCIVNGILSYGLRAVVKLVAVCRNA